MHGVSKHRPPHSLHSVNPDEWNNIAIPLVDAIRLMLKELFRLGLKSEDISK